MLGYAEMKEAVVWLQSHQAGHTYAIYDDLSTAVNENYSTDTVALTKAKALTAKLIFDQVQPGREYSYRLFINGKEQQRDYPFRFTTQKLWAYRTDPPDFTMAMGSCAYISEKKADRPGEPYGGEYEIFRSIAAKDPDVMMWLGDNTYLRPTDWWTKTGYQERYSHTRELEEMQPLLAACPNFAIWDDHEFGPNNSNQAWVQKELALETFKLFWANHSYGYPGLNGITSAFRFNDIDVFMLDNRWHRTEINDAGPEHILGEKQVEMLIDYLKFSRAPFKLVAIGGQLLNSAEVYENHARYPAERDYILKRIAEEEIKGVIFLSGDRHHSEVSAKTLENGIKIWDITSSPLTSKPNLNVTETNDHREEGSLIQERNFTTLTFSGPRKDRKLNIKYYDTEGNELFSYQITADEIYNKSK